MSSLVVTLLAERPEDELRDLRKKAQMELARVQVEVEQIDEALARKRRGSGARQGRRPRGTRSGNTVKLVENVFRSQPETEMSPSEVMGRLEDLGTPPSSTSAVYNAVRRLQERGTIMKVDDGLYRLASRNGPPREGRVGPDEIQTTESLSPATESDEGA